MITLNGIKISDGVVIGRAYIFDKRTINIKKRSISDFEIENEVQKLKNAVIETEKYMVAVKAMSENDFSSSHKFIFDVYMMLLKDEALIGETEKYIREHLVNAEYALSVVSGNLMKMFGKSNDEYLKERKNDIKHIVKKLLNFMVDKGYQYACDINRDLIVIAHDLSPYEAAHLFKQNVKGFALDMGSKVSHTSIIIRALGVPAVVGIENATYSISDGDTVIIDGINGQVIVDPDEDTLSKYREKEERYLNFVSTLSQFKESDVYTKDGVGINLLANVEINDEIPLALEYGSQGVGLYRTEFFYLEKGDLPEDEQFKILKEAVELIQGKQLTVRTFDLGGEKLSNLLPHPDESNPAMGLRAIRYSLRFKEFFKKQMRAILRASAFGDVRIMFPMISGLEEIDKAKKLLEESKEELKKANIEFNENIKIGIMVELPSIALISNLAAQEVDFFSVGTNDLIQYTLGIDRNNEYVAYLYRPSHPAVLTLLRNIIESANKFEIDATVCGEMAGDPMYIPILLGLGYTNLSMSPSQLLKAKLLISQIDTTECKKLVSEMAVCKYARVAEEKLSGFVNQFAGNLFIN
ncbi:phosphoenolpyruvate--protein phosphotransferase [Deferribacteraceae bacterium V6Fe1]|nr:phosphoenolpyruvate--protein phosphotransferase [Deferribacteraceae bacterium V6Fe1]